MTDKLLEQELKSFDYSSLHKVRESLLEKLLARHRQDNRKNIPSLSQRFMAKQMTEDELDYVAAAGNPVGLPLATDKNKLQ